VDISRHSRHVFAALQPGGLIQHPAMRGCAMPLSNLSELTYWERSDYLLQSRVGPGGWAPNLMRAVRTGQGDR